MGIKAYYAYTTGSYLGQDGSTISQGDPGNLIQTVTQAALGVSPQEASDTFMKLDSLKSQADAKKALAKQAIANVITGLKYAGDGDVENATLYYKRATAIFKSGNFTPEEITAARTQAASRMQPLADKANRKFWQADPKNRLSQYQSEYGIQNSEDNPQGAQ
jgi:multidrug resistance efflux pump